MGLLSSKRCYDPDDPEYGWSYGADDVVGWTVSCVSDPRFCASGTAGSFASAAFAIDTYVRSRILELGLEEHEIPKDIEYSDNKY
jgi:hypothetical protein